MYTNKLISYRWSCININQYHWLHIEYLFLMVSYLHFLMILFFILLIISFEKMFEKKRIFKWSLDISIWPSSCHKALSHKIKVIIFSSLIQITVLSSVLRVFFLLLLLFVYFMAINANNTPLHLLFVTSYFSVLFPSTYNEKE
jgi:hypothetical protein